MDITIKKQTSKQTHWTDEQGSSVPYNRTTELERKKESVAYTLANEAKSIHDKLVAYKNKIKEECQKIYTEAMKEASKQGKGNFTWFNFDMSIRVEVQVNDNIVFDSVTIEQAKQKLMDLIEEGITKEKEFLKELITSAFQNTKGQLDTKKVLGLKKHASKIKDERYHQAMKLIDEAIRIPSSRTYYKIAVKDGNGQFQNIDLNLSSIEA